MAVRDLVAKLADEPENKPAWGRRGITPVIRVRGGGTGHVSVAGLACYRPGHRSRLIYRLHCYCGRKSEARTFTWTEYGDLLIAAHYQLPGENKGSGRCSMAARWPTSLSPASATWSRSSGTA
ncbi:MAG TPA: hypothetical protein VF070_18355 [Streptosporangiaceae bacterium]